MTIRLFYGYDQREAIGAHVFVSSVLEHASQPVAMTALGSRGLPVGSNDFTFSRFLVPWLCGYSGHAIFMDGADMLVQADVAELDALFDSRFAVQVVQHPQYRTRNPVKYLGTAMQCPNRDYPRKNWASVMLLNCAHPYWSAFDPQSLQRLACTQLLQLNDLPQSEIGALPDAWNRLVDEGQPVDGAKVLHWTAGIPAFWHYQNAPGAGRWHEQLARVKEGESA